MYDKNIDLECKLIPYDSKDELEEFDIDEIVFELDSKIDLLSSKADKYDYLVAMASGILCGLLDVFWVGEFNFDRGKGIASDKVDKFVLKTAEIIEGKKFDNLSDAVRALENKFPIPSDGNTHDFGGGLQHHLKDFAHHPTIAGLTFSLLTQFTEKSYGEDELGNFGYFEIAEKSKAFIGNSLPDKLFKGTITWFFHLVSDIAGSKDTAGLTGGTGLPGPILSLAKMISTLPLFKNMNVKGMPVSKFLSKLFNGTAGGLVSGRFDFRAEFGIGLELTRQAIPVIANECIVRSFYFIRHLAYEIKDKNIKSFDDMDRINWELVKAKDNPTIARMLTISTGVFTSLDFTEAVISQNYLLSINWIGVGRFAVAISTDLSYGLKKRNLKKIRAAYEQMNLHMYRNDDYIKLSDKFGLSLKQTEILYNLEYFLVLNDIENTKYPKGKDDIFDKKIKWLAEWKELISKNFESFTQVPGAELKWYSLEKLDEIIIKQNPTKPWFRLVLLEVISFEPYFPLKVYKDSEGNISISEDYKTLSKLRYRYKKEKAYQFLNEEFTGMYVEKDYVNRLVKTYNKNLRQLSIYPSLDPKTLSITALMTAISIMTAGVATGPIAIALVGSNFAGLSGAALTSACLAYLGGGAISVGGAGMVGGTIAIIGGGGLLGFGLGASLANSLYSYELHSNQTVLEAARFLTTIKEIYIYDEKDLEFTNMICKFYTDNIISIEKDLVDLRINLDTDDSDQKQINKIKIKNSEKNLAIMKTARKILIDLNKQKP